MHFVLTGLIAIALYGAVWRLRARPRNFASAADRTAARFVIALMLGGITVWLGGAYREAESASSQGTIYRTVIIVAAVLAFYALFACAFGKKVGKQRRLDGAVCFALTGVIAGVYCAILSFRSFPISEGWYSVYARYVNQGMVPYKDFELLFMPLYTYLISLLTRLFGYDLIVLRIFGIALFVGMALLAYGIFRRLFGSWIAMLAAVTAVIFVQSEPPQIFYDYIRVFDLLTYTAALSLLYHVAARARGGSKGGAWPLIVSGIAAAGAFCTRQNSGAFVIAYSVMLLAFLLVLEGFSRRGWKALLVYLASAILPLAALVAYMAATGTLTSFLNLTVTSAIGAKGGLMTVLFAWIPRMLKNLNAQRTFLIFMLALLGYGYYAYLGNRRRGIEVAPADRAAGITFALAILAGIAFAFINRGTAAAFADLKYDGLCDAYFFASVVLFAVAFVWVVRADRQKEQDGAWKWHLCLLAVSGMIVAIGYGCGTSAGLAEGQTGLAVGLVVGLLCHFAAARRARGLRAVALGLAVCTCMSAICYKYVTPYSWWGLTEGDLRDATEEIDADYMRGIKVTPDTKYGIETIVNAIDDCAGAGERIFAFPHIPIFYLLTDRYPETFTLVQWFDVAKDDDVVADIAALRQNPPRVIVHVHVPEDVMASHETLFRAEGRLSGLRQMDAALTGMERENGYVCLASFTLQNYPVEVWRLPDGAAESGTARATGGEAKADLPVEWTKADWSGLREYGYAADGCILFGGGALRLPSVALDPGEYAIVVIGENLDALSLKANGAKQPWSARLSEAGNSGEDAGTRFEFELKESCLGLRIRVVNDADRPALVERIIVERR